MSRRDDRIDADLVVQAAARAHGVRARSGLLEAIGTAAEEQVARWVDELGEEPNTLDDLHRLVLNRCRLRVERVDNDADLARIEAKYPRRALPVQLEFEFAHGTEALVFRNDGTDARSAAKFVAVVDARGERVWRAWFGERHEPSHILCKDPGTSAIFRRTGVERSEPIEQVVDAVAARIGFWPPIVKPALAAALARRSDILDAFDDARQCLASAASIESCYRSFVRLCDFPLLVLRCSYATRKDDKTGASLALRATTIMHNQQAADARVQVPNNYRIPIDSIITRVHGGHFLGARTEIDNLGRWRDSSGKRLAPCRVSVTASDSWAVLVPA